MLAKQTLRDRRQQQSNENKCAFDAQTKQRSANNNKPQRDSSRIVKTVNLTEIQAIKRASRGRQAPSNARTTMGVNNTPSPEGRRRSRSDLPRAASNREELFVRDDGRPGTGATVERRRFQGQEQQRRRSKSRRRLLHEVLSFY